MNLHSPAATKLLGALALLLIIAAGWMFVLGPATSKLAGVREQTQSARDQNDVLGLELLKLKRQVAALDQTHAEAMSLAAKFPPTAEQPQLFTQVTQAAMSAGMGAKSITALTPTPPTVNGEGAPGAVAATPQEGGGLAEQTVTVSVEGTYEATQRLVENLEGLPRAFLIGSVTLGGGSQPGRYTTTITGKMFVMPPAVEPHLPGGS